MATMKNVGWYIDEHERLRLKVKKLTEKISELNKQMEHVEKEALRKFKDENLHGARGRLGVGYVRELTHYNIEDRAELDKFVKRTGRLELFQNRISKSAYEELLALGKAPKKGVSVFKERKFVTQSRRS